MDAETVWMGLVLLWLGVAFGVVLLVAARDRRYLAGLTPRQREIEMAEREERARVI